MGAGSKNDNCVGQKLFHKIEYMFCDTSDLCMGQLKVDSGPDVARGPRLTGPAL